jgi:hypothetical protein
MEVNLLSISYLFFRLAPFIIVCFFTLNSLFNQDLRGIIYLCGLLILIATVVLTPPLGVLVLNIVFLIRFLHKINLLDILWPFEYLYKNFSKILKNLFTKSISIVIIIMLAFSLFFHVLELSRLNKIASGQKINNPDLGISVGFITQFWNDLIYGEDAGFGEDKSGYCMEIAFNGNRIVKPVAASVYGFTYAYLMYFIEKYNLVSHNLPVVMFFPMVALADFGYQYYHKCRPKVTINVLAFILGAFWGLNWGDIIGSTGNASLQYFVGGNQPVCSVPSSQNFVCNVYKNGQLIATQTNPSGSSS